MITLAEGFALAPGWCAEVSADLVGLACVWRQETITIFGRRRQQPRLTCWMGSASYTYSGVRHAPAPLPPVVEELRLRLESTFGEQFNSVLANMYRDGRDSVGWHADDERGMGDAPTIASISLGASREFQIRRNSTGTVTTIELRHGDLLVMSGASQRYYQHCVPKRARAAGRRINLTFRRIVAD